MKLEEVYTGIHKIDKNAKFRWAVKNVDTGKYVMAYRTDRNFNPVVPWTPNPSNAGNQYDEENANHTIKGLREDFPELKDVELKAVKIAKPERAKEVE